MFAPLFWSMCLQLVLICVGLATFHYNSVKCFCPWLWILLNLCNYSFFVLQRLKSGREGNARGWREGSAGSGGVCALCNTYSIVHPKRMHLASVVSLLKHLMIYSFTYVITSLSSLPFAYFCYWAAAISSPVLTSPVKASIPGIPQYTESRVQSDYFVMHKGNSWSYNSDHT